MSVYNIKSTIIANRDATPKVLTGPDTSGGQLMESQGCVQTAAAIIDAASKLILCQVPSNSRVTDVIYSAQSLGTSALDIAVWYPTYIPRGGANNLAASVAGTLISSSSFAVNIAGVDTGLAQQNGLGTLTANTIQKQEQPLWQALGLASDPELNLDMGFVVRTATSVQGYVGLKVRYVN